MTTQEIVEWVRKIQPSYTEEECLDAWRIYKSYRDEGQSVVVSKQYAGLL